MVNLNSATRIANLSVALSTLAFVIGQAPQAKALTFEFDYFYDQPTNGGNNFFDAGTTDGAARRATLEEAATYFTDFTDNLSEISVSGSNTWTPKFNDPHTGASGFEANDFKDLTIAEDKLVIFVSGYNYGDGVTTLGTGSTGSYRFGTQAFINNVKTRGQSGALDTPATDYGTWGGAIAFNTNSNIDWYNGTADGVSAGESDFLSVAIHELGHIMGIGLADSWDDRISGTDFTGAYSKAEFGGNVPLDGGLGHWANGTKSTIDGTGDFETAFDPSLTEGTRKILTDLDYAGLTDVGWETQAVYSAAVPFEFSPGLGIFVVSGFFGINKAWRTFKQQQTANIK